MGIAAGSDVNTTEHNWTHSHAVKAAQLNISAVSLNSKWVHCAVKCLALHLVLHNFAILHSRKTHDIGII